MGLSSKKNTRMPLLMAVWKRLEMVMPEGEFESFKTNTEKAGEK